MRRLELTIRHADGERDRSIRLGRVGSVVVATLLSLFAIAFVIAAVILGYAVIGLFLAMFLIAIIGALIRGAIRGFRS